MQDIMEVSPYIQKQRALYLEKMNGWTLTMSVSSLVRSIVRSSLSVPLSVRGIGRMRKAMV